MECLLDDKIRVNYQRRPSEFSLDVRDTFIHTTQTLIDYLRGMTNEDLHSILDEIDFFKNRYWPAWFKDNHWFLLKKQNINLGTARFDFVFDNGLPKLIELNTACPAGHLLFSTICERVIAKNRGRPIMVHESQAFAKYLIERAQKRCARPLIALIYSKQSPLLNELKLLAKQINKLGVDARVVAIQDLRFIHGFSCIGQTQIDLAWCKFNDDLMSPLAGLVDNDPMYLQSLLKSYHKNKIDLVNPPVNFYLLEDKGILEHLYEKFQQHSQIRSHLTWTKILRPDADLVEEVVQHKNRYMIKPRIGTRGNGALLGSDFSSQQWRMHVSQLAQDYSHVVQKVNDNREIKVKKSAQNLIKEFKNYSVLIYNNTPASIIGRKHKHPIVSVGKGGCFFALSFNPPKAKISNEVLCCFNGHYWPQTPFPGYGCNNLRFFKDLKRIYALLFEHSDIKKIANDHLVFNVRPDLYVSGRKRYILEFNIETAIAPQSHVAFLQSHYGQYVRSATKQSLIPFVDAWQRVLEKFDGSVAFLGSRTGADIYDPIDLWFLNEIKVVSGKKIKFYSAEEWGKLEQIPEKYFFRWLSCYQILRNPDLKHAYDLISQKSIDVMPLEGYQLADNKRNISDLYALAINGKLGQDDCKLVLKYLPWTVNIQRSFKSKYLFSNNKTIDNQFILNNKDHFVLKKMLSHSSRDVYIGKDLSELDWKLAMAKAMEAQDYVVQKYITNSIEFEAMVLGKNRRTKRVRLEYMISPFFIGNYVAGTYVRAWNNNLAPFNFAKRIVGTTTDFGTIEKSRS